ncbi:hypothetical protein DEO72_LG1g3152 [Vigna unguiculata]|uniref:Uncharacterized protein n=1 Tax=Vigna unguiculata TaxID=3917 RepID=A0A4D6KS33_VIGUN|nr:hypothetical protein DEO72_LG1g3152 [Vigna unguiculata]
MFTHPLPQSTPSLNHPLLDLCRTKTPSVSPPLSFSVNIGSCSNHYTAGRVAHAHQQIVAKQSANPNKGEPILKVGKETDGININH